MKTYMRLQKQAWNLENIYKEKARNYYEIKDQIRDRWSMR